MNVLPGPPQCCPLLAATSSQIRGLKTKVKPNYREKKVVIDSVFSDQILGGRVAFAIECCAQIPLRIYTVPARILWNRSRTELSTLLPTVLLV